MKTVDAFSDLRLRVPLLEQNPWKFFCIPWEGQRRQKQGWKIYNTRKVSIKYLLLSMVDLIWHTRICYLQYASAVFLQPAPAGHQSSLVLVISLPHGTDNISHWQILQVLWFWTCRFKKKKLMWLTKIYVNWLNMKAVRLCICQILKCKLLTTVWIGRLSNWIICYSSKNLEDACGFLWKWEKI